MFKWVLTGGEDGAKAEHSQVVQADLHSPVIKSY